VLQAIAAVEAAWRAGFVWTVKADIKSYFERIAHRELERELAIWLDDEGIMRLMDKWLATFGWRGKGLAQGAPISPLLANLYLHPIDRLITAAGYPVVRYADDLVVMARSAEEAQRALRLVASHLRARKLSLNPARTRIIAPGQSFTFLGREISSCGATDRSHFQSSQADLVIGSPTSVMSATECRGGTVI
jgi:CRISPR-associated protein Cas1